MPGATPEGPDEEPAEKTGPLAPNGQDLPLPVYANDMLITSEAATQTHLLTFRMHLQGVDERQVVARVVVPDGLYRQWASAAGRDELVRQLQDGQGQQTTG